MCCPTPRPRRSAGRSTSLNYLGRPWSSRCRRSSSWRGSRSLVGEWTRRPVLVFLLPVAIVIVERFFLWEWSPGWLDPRIDRALMLLDPAGFRWLNETWLKVDRGVALLQHGADPARRWLPGQPGGIVALGLGAVAPRAGGTSPRPCAVARAGARAADGRETPARDGEPHGTRRGRGPCLGPAGRAGDDHDAGRASRRRLARRPGRARRAPLQPGLYLFIPLLLLQTLGHGAGRGRLPRHAAPGHAGRLRGARRWTPLTTCLCLLLLFYTVESLERERSTRLAAIAHATPDPDRLAAPGQGRRAGGGRRWRSSLAVGLAGSSRS